MASGFLRLHRKFFEHSFWKEDRKLSPAEAWLYLIANARFEIKPEKKLVKMKTITVHRGEIHASIRFLAGSWKWSVGKVQRFIDLLESQDMIKRRTIHSETIITLLNYNEFNPIEKDERYTDRYTNDTPLLPISEILPEKQNSKQNGDESKNDTDNNLNNSKIQEQPIQTRYTDKDTNKHTNDTYTIHRQVQTKESKESKNSLFRQRFFSVLEIFYFKNYKNPVRVTNTFFNHYEGIGWKNARGLEIEDIIPVAENWSNKTTEGKNCPDFLLVKWKVMFVILKNNTDEYTKFLLVRPAKLENGILIVRGRQKDIESIETNQKLVQEWKNALKLSFGVSAVNYELEKQYAS